MLRVGLTGDLGSGKSTVARMLAARGAIVFSSDEMARAMMQPGHAVYAAIVEHFGQSILAPDNTLDRRKLAALAFDSGCPRVAELNAIVHPAVLRAQAEQIAALVRTHPHAIVVVESALIFSTQHAPQGPWKDRFDRIVLVTAPEETELARFLDRAAHGRKLSEEERRSLETDGRQRLANQNIVERNAQECLVLHNDSGLAELKQEVDALWQELQRLEYEGSSGLS